MDLQILTDGKSTKQLIKPSTHDKIKKGIESYLLDDKFNYIVVADNLKEVKANNVELNKSIKIIKDFGKKLVDLESSDINTFKYNIKEYWNLIEEKRQSRLKEIEVYEEQTRNALKILIADYVSDEYIRLNIRDNFHSDVSDGLVIVSNINEKTNTLASKCKKELDMIIQSCKSKQDKYDMRVMGLENSCFRLGLSTPLTVEHIQGIIYIEDDVDYNLKLDSLIAKEVERNEAIRKRIVDEETKKILKETSKQLEQQRQLVDNTFLDSFGQMEIEQLKERLISIQDFNISSFDLCLDYAKDLQKRAITKINQCIYAKEKALEDTKEVVEYNTDDSKSFNQTNTSSNATYRDKKPFLKEVDTKIVDDKQIYNIEAVFQISANVGSDKIKIQDTIKSILLGGDSNKITQLFTSETLVSLEVV